MAVLIQEWVWLFLIQRGCDVSREISQIYTDFQTPSVRIRVAREKNIFFESHGLCEPSIPIHNASFIRPSLDLPPLKIRIKKNIQNGIETA